LQKSLSHEVTLLTHVIAVFASAEAQQTAKSVQHSNLTKEGIALEGYDAVSYFKAGGPKKGAPQWKVVYDGATYFFASEGNRAEFMRSPASFAPAYGGWCAYAVGATSDKVEVDPLTFKILKGKLLLFYNKRSINTLLLWEKQENSLFEKAEQNWLLMIKR